MRRDAEEIRQSYEGFFGKPFSATSERIEVVNQKFLENAKNRRDIKSLDIFWYKEVIENPKKYFQILKDNGWPINVGKAVLVVNPKLYRFRKEKLTIGI